MKCHVRINTMVRYGCTIVVWKCAPLSQGGNQRGCAGQLRRIRVLAGDSPHRVPQRGVQVRSWGGCSPCWTTYERIKTIPGMIARIRRPLC